MLINQSTLNALYQSFSLIFQNAFSAVAPQWPRVAMSVQTQTKSQQYGFLGAFPRMREWIGDREMQNLMTHDFTIKNKDFEAAIEVDRNDIEDDILGIYNPIVQEFARIAATHPDELIFSLLANGTSNKCYDGKAFFADNHPVGKQSVSNFSDSSGTPWYLLDTTRAVKAFVFQKRRDLEFVSLDKLTDPQVFMKRKYVYGIDARYNAGYGLWQLAYRSELSLDATNYAAARAAMMSYKDDQGRPLGIMPNLLVVPPALEGDARALLLNSMNAAGATNTWQGTSELLVVPLIG
ncbi:MAG: Mu-like prophage major head subunit gpT family protein [Candidatus Magnetominusculus sp. LBB02]|nr:Mu-like prophage major head subunit gpT family protein [Candidatus Magnetominusculus sp. LBB02]